jgi:hypothetical protein
MVDDCVVPLEEQASTLRELGCYDEANELLLSGTPDHCYEKIAEANTYIPMDDNLTNTKPVPYRRLNSN